MNKHGADNVNDANAVTAAIDSNKKTPDFRQPFSVLEGQQSCCLKGELMQNAYRYYDCVLESHYCFAVEPTTLAIRSG